MAKPPKSEIDDNMTNTSNELNYRRTMHAGMQANEIARTWLRARWVTIKKSPQLLVENYTCKLNEERRTK